VQPDFYLHLNDLKKMNNELDKIIHNDDERISQDVKDFFSQLGRLNKNELNTLKHGTLYSKNIDLRKIQKDINNNINEKESTIRNIKNILKSSELSLSEKNSYYSYMESIESDLEKLYKKNNQTEKLLIKLSENKSSIFFHRNLENIIYLTEAFILYNEDRNKIRFFEKIKMINPSENTILYHMSILIFYFVTNKEHENLNTFFRKYFSFQDIFNTLLLSPSINSETLKIKNSPFIDYDKNNIGSGGSRLSNLMFFNISLPYDDVNFEINLLLIQMYTLNILSNLLVDFNSDFERKVSHYTSTFVAEKLITDESKIRLNFIEFMNDPTEGKILYNLLNINNLEVLHHSTFLTCFTFNHNSLNQFRLYGLTNNIPCSGVSVVFNKSFFYSLSDSMVDEVKMKNETNITKLPLFRCIYIDEFSGHIEVAKRNKFTFFQEYKDKSMANKKWGDYIKFISKIEENISNYISEMLSVNQEVLKNKNYEIVKILNNITKPLAFLFKHFAFQEEQECRILKIQNIENDEVIIDSNLKTTYINYEKKCNEHIANLYIGIQSKDIKNSLIKKIKEKKLTIPKTKVTENPFFFNNN